MSAILPMHLDETVDAEQRGDPLRGLVQTAGVPWDDRPALEAQVEDLREAKVREHLRDIGSGLLDEPDAREVYRRMRLTMKVNDHEAPRNVGLLFFSREPEEWFRGARIEAVHFTADRAGDVLEDPGRIEVISYPGPVPGIEPGQLVPDAQVRAAPARNRRIGEFLKELGLAEGRLTGLPKVFRAMEANGSPAPRFEFDEQRTWFQATLPAHPEYAALSAVRDSAHLRVLGEHEQALRRIESAWESDNGSAILAAEVIRLYAAQGEAGRAEEVLRAFEAHGPESAVAHVGNALIEALMEAGDEEKAQRLLRENRPARIGQDAIDAAILARRARDSRAAHRYFQRAGDSVHADPRALLEFAQTKIELGRQAHRRERETRTGASSRRPGRSWSA